MQSIRDGNDRSRKRIVVIVGTVLATIALVGAQPAVAHHKAKCTSTGVSYPSPGVAISAMSCVPVEHKTRPEPSKAKPAVVKKPAPAPTNREADAGPLFGARRPEPADFVPLGNVRAANDERKTLGAGPFGLGVVLAGGMGLISLRGRVTKRNRTVQRAI